MQNKSYKNLLAKAITSYMNTHNYFSYEAIVQKKTGKARFFDIGERELLFSVNATDFDVEVFTFFNTSNLTITDPNHSVT